MNKTLSGILLGLVSFIVTIGIIWLLFERPDKQAEPTTQDQTVIQNNTDDNAERSNESSKQEDLKNDEVIRINDKTYTKKDIDFLRSMQKAQIEHDLKGNSELHNQLKNQDSENLQLQNRVELDVVSGLAKQKGYDVNDERLAQDIKSFEDKYGQTDSYKKAKEKFAESFKKHQEQYVKDLALRKRLIEEIRKIVKADHPGIKQQELDYEMRQYFDDLYKSAMADVKIKTKYGV